MVALSLEKMCSRSRLAYLSRLAIQGLSVQSEGSLLTRASNTLPGFHQQLRMKSTDSKGHPPGKTKTVVASGGALRFRGPPGTRGGISSRLANKNLVSKPSKDAWKVVGYSMADSFDLVTLQQQIAQQVRNLIILYLFNALSSFLFSLTYLSNWQAQPLPSK